MSKKKLKRSSLLKGFVIKAAITLITWLILYYGIIIPDGRLNQFLTQSVITGTTFGLNLLGYETKGSERIIYIDNQAVVMVADNCNGLELFALYVGFLLCFPGRLKYKSLFIPLGIGLIFLLNVIREIVLALNYKFFRATFDFNHKYTYVLVVYLFVFVIWRYWLNNYSILANYRADEA